MTATPSAERTRREPSTAREKVHFPAAFEPLFFPKRYKIMEGGRGSAKSWSAGRALLLLGSQVNLRVVCAREIQNSIRQSVYQLLSDQIAAMNLGHHYTVLRDEIRGKLGTEFSFHGLRHNIDNIKSLEGADVVWVEEAQSVSEASWRKLTPTVRKAGSEIWVTYNPELESDPTYQRFHVDAPDDSVVMRVSWRDNPWWSEELEAERQRLFVRDPDMYRHVYEGETIQHLEGTVYAREMRQAEADGRITRVPYSEAKPVHVYVDLGWGDKTSLWFEQRIGVERRVIHSYQNRHQLWQHYLKYIQDRGYVVGCIWLPHDAESGSIAGLSVAKQTREAGFTTRVLPRVDNALALGVDAARAMFSQCWFDREGCADGLQALRHYRYEIDEHGRYGSKPAHDESSHFADAFRYMAVADSVHAARPDQQTMVSALRQRPNVITVGAGLGWLGR